MARWQDQRVGHPIAQADPRRPQPVGQERDAPRQGEAERRRSLRRPGRTRRTSLQGPDTDSSSRRPDAGGPGRRAHASLHRPLPADRRSRGGAEGAPLVTQRCVAALRLLKDTQDIAQEKAGERWKVTDLVFCTRTGTPVTAHNVRRDFRKVVEAAGLTGREWPPRELRHSFVSVLSDSGVPIKDISCSRSTSDARSSRRWSTCGPGHWTAQVRLRMRGRQKVRRPPCEATRP